MDHVIQKTASVNETWGIVLQIVLFRNWANSGCVNQKLLLLLQSPHLKEHVVCTLREAPKLEQFLTVNEMGEKTGHALEAKIILAKSTSLFALLSYLSFLYGIRNGGIQDVSVSLLPACATIVLCSCCLWQPDLSLTVSFCHLDSQHGFHLFSVWWTRTAWIFAQTPAQTSAVWVQLCCLLPGFELEAKDRLIFFLSFLGWKKKREDFWVSEAGFIQLMGQGPTSRKEEKIRLGFLQNRMWTACVFVSEMATPDGSSP